MLRTLRPVVRAAGALALVSATLSAPGARAAIVERVVAVVGDKPILLTDLRSRGRPFLAQIYQGVPQGAQRAAAESQMYQKLLDQMIDDELLAQAAQKAQVTVSSDEVDAAIRNVAAGNNITVEALLAEAQARGLTVQEYRDVIRRQVLEAKVLQLRVKGRVRITETDLRSMYERVRRDEQRRLPFRASWIVLRIAGVGGEEGAARRLAFARTLVKRAREGEDFAALARTYSDDNPTADLGGDLGYRGTHRAPAGTRDGEHGVLGTPLSPPLEEAVTALEPGQVTEPLRAGDAVVILKLTERAPTRYPSFGEAQDELTRLVYEDQVGKAKRAWLDELRRRTHVDVRL